MLLPWDVAAETSAALVAITATARASRRPRALAVAAFTAETAIVLGLYALWQWAGTLGQADVPSALVRGKWIWDVEQRWHWPSELAVERLVLPHSLLAQTLNLYYLTVHVPALVAFLIWLFVRHRGAYPAWRTTGAILTGVCLAIQLVSVAPPRLLPQLGFVDLAARYGQSAYTHGGLGADTQVAAMPSVHVAWAAYIAVAVIIVSTSKWRWLVLAHPIGTVFVVVATANHWWLDGVVGIVLIPVCYGVQALCSGGVAAWRGRRAAARQPVAVVATAEEPVPTG
jgi:hypothetical protein